MDHETVGRYWDANAEAWTQMSRRGHDVCRDHINTPAFLSMLPQVSGLSGLDIGCGEGHNTRLLADRGASMTAIDIAPAFLEHARQHERDEPRGIDYRQASAVKLPFEPESFDFCAAFMSLMDLGEQDLAIAEAQRVLRPGGFLQFSICHPCFQTPMFSWVHDADGERAGLVCGDYYSDLQGDIEEWTFSSAPSELREQYPLFKVPRFFRTLSGWLNLLLDTGFQLERFSEPQASEASIAQHPRLAWSRKVPLFLIVLARKPLR